MKKTIRLKIYGQVQGVSFRYYTREKAKQLGITGWVRNEPDGTVLLEASGEDEKLEEFFSWCCQGPSAAKVKKVETEEPAEPLKMDSFEIKY